jgi:hypothetical protein
MGALVTSRRQALAFAFMISLLVGSATMATADDPIVDVSLGRQVTAQDLAQFDIRWMGAKRLQRLTDYEWALKNRQAWVAWGVADDAMGMVRLFEVTRDRKYLDHLRAVAEIALRYRDDNHPGDDFPNGDNPICLNCRPPFSDRERGGVQSAWGSGILYSDYVGDGGLTPVDAVTSGIYAYAIAAFARIVAEDTSLQADYGADAVRFANAALQTMWAFLPQLDSRQVGDFVEGSINRPSLFPTSHQCAQAHDDAVDHVRRFSGATPAELADLLDRIDKAKSTCEKTGRYAGKPLAHNESGSLMMSFIELWRALDSELYRRSPQGASNAELAHGLIPIIVARHQRYFVNRLEIRNDSVQDQRYFWHYNDDVPNPHTEDTSHGNLDMSYLDVLRRSLDRLNAKVAPAGEPIPLDDAMVRRFANTFLQQIARQEEIDGGGNLRSDVDGKAASDNGKGGPDYNNPLCDGWVSLASADATIYRLCQAVSLRKVVSSDTPNGSQKYLTIANHSALFGTKSLSREVDRSAQFGTPPAAGPPTACVIAGLGVHNIAYRDPSGRLHELWRDANGATGTTNLTDNAGAPAAAGNPFAYVDTSTSSEILLYRGGDNNVHSLYWSRGPVGHDNLTGSVGAPKTAGDPVGWFTAADGFHHVVYRTGDGHLHELWWSGPNPVGHGDLTAAASAPPAAGKPTAYVDTLHGDNIVVYRSGDGHVRSLYWSSGPVGQDDLSGFAGTPMAAADPVAYYTPHNDTHQIVYRSANGHLYELYWQGAAPVSGWDLTVPAGAPAATGNPAAYYSAGTNTKHVIYRSADGRLHEIWWVPGGGVPAHVDLTAFAGAPLAVDEPAAFTVEGLNTQHVAYRGPNGHIYEMLW